MGGQIVPYILPRLGPYSYCAIFAVMHSGLILAKLGTG